MQIAKLQANQTKTNRTEPVLPKSKIDICYMSLKKCGKIWLLFWESFSSSNCSTAKCGQLIGMQSNLLDLPILPLYLFTLTLKLCHKPISCNGFLVKMKFFYSMTSRCVWNPTILYKKSTNSAIRIRNRSRNSNPAIC